MIVPSLVTTSDGPGAGASGGVGAGLRASGGGRRGRLRSRLAAAARLAVGAARTAGRARLGRRGPVGHVHARRRSRRDRLSTHDARPVSVGGVRLLRDALPSGGSRGGGQLHGRELLRGRCEQRRRAQQHRLAVGAGRGRGRQRWSLLCGVLGRRQRGAVRRVRERTVGDISVRSASPWDGWLVHATGASHLASCSHCGAVGVAAQHLLATLRPDGNVPRQAACRRRGSSGGQPRGAQVGRGVFRRVCVSVGGERVTSPRSRRNTLALPQRRARAVVCEDAAALPQEM